MPWYGIVALALVAILAVWLWAIAPTRGARARFARFFGRDYAHRGLHGDAPENSLAAFDAAAEKGYGIELDVRLTKDKRLVILHDDDLSRMCGVTGLASEKTLEEVTALRLNGSQERVPTLDEALAVIAGRVPVIVEMKSNGREHSELPRLLHERMARYGGLYCVESFDPLMVRAYRNLAPDVPRGQLACILKVKEHRALAFALSRCLFNFLSRPDFIAYESAGREPVSVKLWRAVYGAPLVSWTTRLADAYHALKGRYDTQIFEHFNPETGRKEERA